MQFMATMAQQHFPFSSVETNGTEELPIADCRLPNAEFSIGNLQSAIPNPPAATRPVLDASGPPATGDGSLLDLYQTTMRARRMRSAGAAAIAEHESGMRAFDRFFAWSTLQQDSDSKNLRFFTPKAFLSEKDVLSAFSTYLITVEGRSTATVCKRLTNLIMVAKALKLDLDKPTPNEVKRIHAEHQQLKANDGETQQVLAARKIPSWSEIDAMAKSVAHCRYPYDEHGPYFLRGWIRFLAYIGPRSRDVVSVIKRKPGLLKKHVVFDTLCPIEDVNAALGTPLHSPHGWLYYPIGKDNHSENRMILFPMLPWLRNWLTFFMELSPCECDRVFPSVMKNKIGWHSQKQMTREWNATISAAGVDPRLVPSEGTGGRIALRKFAANWWGLETSKTPAYAHLSDKMENYVLHHVPKSTSKKHYVSDQAKLLPVMIDLMHRFPVPAADAPHVSLLPE